MRVNSEGSGETVQMRRLAWAFAGRLSDKYHNRMSWFKSPTRSYFQPDFFPYWDLISHFALLWKYGHMQYTCATIKKNDIQTFAEIILKFK